METDLFPEVKHPLIKPLLEYSDQELVNLFQQEPDQGKYFVAIFCRYSALVKTIITDSVSSYEEVPFLERLTWNNIFSSLPQLSLTQATESEIQTLANWLSQITRITLEENDLKPFDLLKPNLEIRLLPLNFYLEKALNQFPPLHRLIFLLTEKFSWSGEQIIAYLEQQGELITIPDLESYLEDSYYLLETNLPQDIRSIYLGSAE